MRIKNKFNQLTDIKTKILLQIHDELIFETPKNELSKIIPIIKTEMSGMSSSAFHTFSIPLTVDINSGENWGVVH